MESFGHALLCVNGIIEGKSLSYGFSNKQIPGKLQDLQKEFHFKFSRWLTSISYYFEDFDSITNQDLNDYKFLKSCVNNIENISNENLDWYTPDNEVVD